MIGNDGGSMNLVQIIVITYANVTMSPLIQLIYANKKVFLNDFTPNQISSCKQSLQSQNNC
jgi:hypothetical protein